MFDECVVAKPFWTLPACVFDVRYFAPHRRCFWAFPMSGCGVKQSSPHDVSTVKRGASVNIKSSKEFFSVLDDRQVDHIWHSLRVLACLGSVDLSVFLHLYLYERLLDE